MKLSQAELEKKLVQLGVRPGMALEVHCSLSGFGTLEGGAETLIETLIQLVGNGGAIVMPSFRLSKDLPLSGEDRALGLTKKIRILGVDIYSLSAMHSVEDVLPEDIRERLIVAAKSRIFLNLLL